MATGKIIGTIEVALNGVKILGVDGSVRDAVYGGPLYEGEQIISTNPEALFQVKYVDLAEPAAYEGVFRVLADGSVITGSDVMDSIVSDKNLADIFQTAAGEGDVAESSGYIPSDMVAESHVLGFGRDESGPLGSESNRANALEEGGENLNNHAPEVGDVAIAATEDIPTNVTGQIPGSDADGNAFTYHIVDGLGEGEGSVTLNPDGTFIYNVGEDFQYLAQGETTQVSFTYQASEVPGSPPTNAGPFDSNVGTMTITVTGTNDQPVVSDINANSAGDLPGDLPGEIVSTQEGEGSAVTIANGNIVQIGDQSPGDDYEGPQARIVTLPQENGSSIDYWHFTHSGGPLTIDMLTEYGSPYVDVNGDASQSELDSYIYLYHDTGSFNSSSYVDSNDDSDADGTPDGDDGEADGSLDNYDSYLDFNDLPAGDYVLVVGGYSLDETSIQNGINPDSSYEGPYQITFTSESPLVFNGSGTNTQVVYETHDNDAYQNGADDTQDDANLLFTGSLDTVQDVDLIDTHTYYLVDNDNIQNNQVNANIVVDSTGTSLGMNATVEITDAIAGTYQIEGDFTNLADGEHATVTFEYVAVDNSDDNNAGDRAGLPIAPNESDTSAPALVTLTITGTNDQPIVDNVTISALESHDNDAYQNSADDTQDDDLTAVSGTLLASDDDVNNTHIFDALSMGENDNEEDEGSQFSLQSVVYNPTSVLDSVDYYQNGESGHPQQIEVLVESTDINPYEIDVSKLIFTSNDGADSEAAFELQGDYNALGTGESATITFKYIADDQRGFGMGGDTNNEASVSEVKTVTVTITGTNDQPIASDIVERPIYETHDNYAYQNSADDTQDDVYTVLESNLATAQDDDVNNIHTYQIVNESLGVDTPEGVNITDLSVTLDANSGDYTLSGNFNALATGESATVTFQYQADDGQGFGAVGDANNEASLSEPKTVTITVMGTNDQPIVSDIVRGDTQEGQNPIYETHDNDAYQNDADDTQDDVLTRYEANLLEQQPGAMINDDDVHDTHTFYLVGDSISVPTLHVTLGQHGGDTLGLDNWGEEVDGSTRVMELDNGMIITTSSDSGDLKQYNHEAGHVGEGIADSDGLGINNGEKITVALTGGLATSAIFSFDGLGGHFDASGVDAKATWIAYNNGVAVANGEVSRTDDNVLDNFVEVSASEAFDTVEFSTVSTSGSNWELRYVDVDVQQQVEVTVAENGDYSVEGNFNYLGVGESETVSFNYYAQDNRGFGVSGDADNEASVSEPKTVSLTITGTNDQPIIEHVEITTAYETALDAVTYGADVDLGVNDLIQTSGADAQEGSAVKVVVDSAAGETVTFDWAFDSRDADYMHDTAFVIVDGVVSTLAEGAVDANGTFSYTFTTAGEHTIVAGVLNNHDDQGYGGSSLLTLNNLQGGILLSTESFGAVTGNGVDGYDLSANSNLPASELGSFIDMQSTTYENAHLSGSLENVIDVSDDDVNDAYSYVAFNDRIVDFTEESSGVPLITTPIRVSLDEDGNYDVVSTSFDKLGEGESVTITFDVQVRDDSGINDNGDANNEAALSEAKTVTIVINGTNDSPVLAAVTTDNAMEPDLTGLFNIHGTEIPEDALVSGQLDAAVSDEDVNDGYSFVAQGSYNLHDWSPAFATVTDTNGVIHGNTYLQVNEDGSYKVFNPSFNNLGTGESVTVSFNVQVQDDSGVGTGNTVDETSFSNTRTVTFTVTGTNDQPVVDNVRIVTHEALGAGLTSVSGAFYGDDEDTNDLLTYNAVSMDRNEPVTDIAGANFVRVMNVPYDSDGNGVYEGNVDIAVKLPHGVNVDDIDITGIRVDGNQFTLEGDFNALPQGTRMVVKFLYNATDDSGANVTNGYDESDVSDVAVAKVIIHGTNDIADISVGTGQDSGEVAEDTIFTVDGQLGISDLDAGEAFFNTTVTVHPGNTTAYGTLSIDANGAWEYVLNNDAAQELNAGEIAVEKFIVFSLDGTDSQIIEISIHGMNDAPVLVADVNSVTEAGVDVPAAANLHGNVLDNDADVDHGASLAVVGIMSNNLGTDDISFNSNDRLVLRGEYGQLSMDENGHYSYNLLDNDPDTDALKQGEEVNDVFTYRVSDGQGGFDTQTLTIHITGTNDAPVINESLSDTTALEFAGLNGEYYGVDTQIYNLAQFQSIVMSNNPDATFRATDISYGEHGVTTYPGISGGRDVSTAESLQTFLGDDANTLSRDPGNTSDGGVHMSGAVYLAAGTYNFQVTADDGYQITIDGNSVAEYAYNQSPTTQTHYYFTIENDGYHSVDMLWWDQGGEYVFQPQLRMGDGEYQTFSSENFAFRATAEASVIEAGTTDSGAEVAGVDMVIGTMVASDVDHDASLTWSVDDPDDTYGTFGIDANTGQWTYILDNSLAATDALEEGQMVTQTFNVVVTDEFGATDTQPVTITIQGTNDAPIATADVITKVTDHVEYDEVMMDAQVIGDGFELTTTTSNGMVWYGINDLHDDQDNQNLIDSKGSYNEGISFTLLGEAESATVSFKNANDNLQGNDNIAIALYLDHNLVANLDTSTIGNGAFTISGYGAFDEIRISAEDMDTGNTQFRVSQVVTADDVTLDTVLSFTIDDSMLLANDSDVDNHSDLSLVINDTSLYASDNSVIGTVGLDGDGNVVVTPDSIVEFNDDAQAYAHFNYSVVDEHGAQSDVVSATIDVALGTVTNNEVSYTEQTPQEFIIGTDEGTTPEAFAENVLVVSDTLNLSHVSDINTVELGSSAQVQGSGDGSPLAAITASDVISATDTDNTLVINSTDTNAADQVSVDTTSLTQGADTTIGSVEYASYSGDDGATLLIQIDDTLDVT